MSKLLVDEISDADNTGPVTVTDGAVVNRTGNGTIIDLQSGGTTVGSIGTDIYSQLFIGEGSTTGFRFDSSANRIMPGATNTSDNLTDLGASTSRFKDLYLSGGVYLGGTGAANKLDDYEEGTWTPAWSATGTTFTYTANGQVGRYVKVGELVTAYCYTGVSAVSGTKGAVTLTGLPFALANVTNSYVPTWIGQIYNVDWPATAKQLFAYAGPNTSHFQFNWSQDANVQISLTGAQLESVNTGVMVGISYRV